MANFTPIKPKPIIVSKQHFDLQEAIKFWTTKKSDIFFRGIFNEEIYGAVIEYKNNN